MNNKIRDKFDLVTNFVDTFIWFISIFTNV